MNKAIVQAIACFAAVIVSVCLHAFAYAQPGDALSAAESRFLAAREAARRGDHGRLESLADQASGHPLDSYIRYWLLSSSLSKASSMPQESVLNRFISDEAGTLLAERLRVDWLRRMARDGDWSYFLQVYPSLQNPDGEMRCHAWNARLATGDGKVLDEIARSWPSLTFAHSSCSSVMREAVYQGKVSTDDAWRLFRRRVDTKSPAHARVVLGWVAPEGMRVFEQAVRSPKHALDCMLGVDSAEASGIEASSVKTACAKTSSAKTSGTKVSGTKASGTKASGAKASGAKASGTKASGTKASKQSARKQKRAPECVPSQFANARVKREMALAALTRLARADVSDAYVRFQRLSGRLTPEERAHAWGVLAMHAAQNHSPEAASWFHNAGNAQMSVTQRAWRVRVPLRVGDWSGVLAAIDKLNVEERAMPEWVYWRGRALKSLGRASEAEKEFRRIASVPNFYGILANEELGNPFDPRAAHTVLAVSAAAEEAAAEEVAEGGSDDVESDSEADSGENGGEGSSGENNGETIQAEAGARGQAVAVNGPSADNHPGFKRAMALFQLDMRMEAIREWNWALRGRDEAFRIAAAQLALKNRLYDRAITSAELANPAGAWELRFLTPYREIIEPRVHANSLDLGWVYGVMRQESRFIIPARSPVGAQGLMQVMPKTGKWVAKSLGMQYHPGLLRDPVTNVEIGTGYMRILLDELEGDQVLAAAGYNAGPGRARRWRASRPLEGAIYAETIPFEETRDYVKHVMTNAVIYTALLQGRPQSLKARLGTIMPKMSD
ncbi:MAG: lytic transglycosylase domain-containing protein [Betaproteobacteria bacterium]|nr:lytic transglycosylase domain-containing protein [Betaproteobacteria bacterium]